MARLRLWIAATLGWLLVFFNIERFHEPINLASFVYVLAAAVAMVTVAIARVRRSRGTPWRNMLPQTCPSRTQSPNRLNTLIEFFPPPAPAALSVHFDTSLEFQLARSLDVATRRRAWETPRELKFAPLRGPTVPARPSTRE